MSETPTYLGLLNGISLAESRAHCWFDAWIEVTHDPAVREVLQLVSYREGEHGLAFAKRINELGHELVEKEDPRGEQMMAIASSDLPDIEKFRQIGLDRVEEDVLGYFDTVFADHTIDIQTGALLGRYIAEEHDTARRFRACYEALEACERDDGGRGRASDDRIDALAGQVETLCRAIEDLRQVVDAQTMPSTNGNGNGKAAKNGKTATAAKRARR